METDVQRVKQDIERILESAGVSVFGYADVSGVMDQIDAPHREAVGERPVAVSFGIGLPHPVVDGLQAASVDAARLYKHHAYDVINLRLDLAASQVTQAIQRAGFRALPVPASQRLDGAELRSLFPHKTAAHLAGLGWIGRNCLLITPEFGPRIRFATVLTDLPLKEAAQRMSPRCGNCTACVDVCPARALTGRPFDESEGRDLRFAATHCREHLTKKRERTGLDVCGLCLYVCPFGRSAVATG